MELTMEQYKQVVSYIKQKIDNKLEKTDPALEEMSNVLKEHILKRAKNKKFEMHYQPKYRNDGKTYSAEALFRMKNLDSITASFPNSFVDPEVAFYLIGEVENLTEFVVTEQITKICNDAKENNFVNEKLGGNANYKISINVPMNCLNENFVNHLSKSLKSNGLEPKNIQIEILETEDFNNLSNYGDIINELKTMGVTFALDDFGSRNADKNALSKLKYDCVKIDKGILDDAKKTKDYSIVAKKYKEIQEQYPDATIVIEGVDGDPDANGDRKKSFKEVLKHLQEIGEMEYQGWGFSKAIPASELGGVLHKQSKNSEPSGMGE